MITHRHIHFVTSHYVAWHCIALHYTTLHYNTKHYIALHCMALRYTALDYITLHYIALQCITLHQFLHTYIHTYIHTYMHTYMQTYIHTYTRASIHPYIHVSIHPYIHTTNYTCTNMYAIRRYFTRPLQYKCSKSSPPFAAHRAWRSALPPGPQASLPVARKFNNQSCDALHSKCQITACCQNGTGSSRPDGIRNLSCCISHQFRGLVCQLHHASMDARQVTTSYMLRWGLLRSVFGAISLWRMPVTWEFGRSCLRCT